MKVRTPPEAVFMSADNQPYLREFHCNGCGSFICRITGNVVMTADNSGPLPSDGSHFVEVVCDVSSCRKSFRLFTLPPAIPEFIPTIRVNGITF